MQSLLGQFYSRIKGSQEDIASEGLAYILQKSKSARLAINRIIKSDCNLDFDDLSFITQNVGDKLERPDISAYDFNGKEVLILEAKFWASLTDNQPLTYLKRLQKDSALLFGTDLECMLLLSCVSKHNICLDNPIMHIIFLGITNRFPA